MKKASKETCEGLAERSRRPCVLNISSRLGPISRSEGLEQNRQEIELSRRYGRASLGLFSVVRSPWEASSQEAWEPGFSPHPTLASPKWHFSLYLTFL